MKKDYYLIGWPEAGSKIAAIKELRNALRIGLVEGREWVDEVEVNGYKRLALTDEERAQLQGLRLLPAPPLAPEPVNDCRPRIRVRVAVVVNEHRKWNAAGWSRSETGEPAGQDAMDAALDGLVDECNELRQWIEADVLVPEVETVVGTAVEEVTG